MEAFANLNPWVVSTRKSVARGTKLAEAFARSGEAIGIPRNDNEMYLATGGTVLTTLGVLTYTVCAWWALGVLRALRDDHNADDREAEHHQAAC